MRQRYPKYVRLLKSKEFSYVRKKGRRSWGQTLIIDTKPTKNSFSRLGISVSRRYGKAVQRNLFKRRIRELFRLHRAQFSSHRDIHVSAQFKRPPHTYTDLKEEFLALVEKT